jgi:hypothetical protein
MSRFNTHLLREKFVIHDSAGAVEVNGDPQGPVVALSNRISIDLTDEKGRLEDTMVVRAHNMHICARIVSRIIQSHDSGGSLLTRALPFDWEAMWDTVVSEYETNYNKQLWGVVYSGGKILFAKGSYHPFLDVIENCQASNRGEYEKSIRMAEDTFRTNGKIVRIDYDGNVALTLHLEPRQSRIGVIVRNPQKTATFNFSVAAKAERDINHPQCIGAAAAFLEGIQLAFVVGMNEEKIKLGKIERHSRDEKMTRDGRARLSRLNAEISTLEGTFEVRYRPERPQFEEILAEAEKMAKSMFAKPAKR